MLWKDSDTLQSKCSNSPEKPENKQLVLTSASCEVSVSGFETLNICFSDRLLTKLSVDYQHC